MNLDVIRNKSFKREFDICLNIFIIGASMKFQRHFLVYEKKAHFAYSKIPSSAQTVGSLFLKKDLVGVADRLQVLDIKNNTKSI